MKIKSGLLLALVFAASTGGSIAQDTNTATTPAASAPTSEVMPLIVIDDAPLSDAIRNLARQAGINLLFDPAAAAAMTNDVSFRLENITAEDAMQALLDNNGFQIVHDPKTKISRVTTKDPAALEPLITQVITLKYSHATNMMPIVTASFTQPRSRVLPDAKNNQLVVLATAAEMQNITNTIAQLDISPRQVLIEARFIETFHNPQTAKGINWAGTARNREVSFGNTVVGGQGFGDPGFGTIGSPGIIGSTARGFGPIAFLNTEQLSATLNFFNSDNQTETLSTPRAVALDGQPTELAVVRNVPVLEQEQGAAGTGGSPPTAVKVRYEIIVGGTIINEVGVRLLVTPRIYAGSNVFLDLKPEISQRETIDAVQTFDNNEFSAPIFSRRRITTQAMVPSGTTLVLGGLISDQNIQDKTKVPILGDVPGLGRAFRSSSKSRTKQHLLIFVTPTILDNDDYLPSPENREFLHQKPIDKPDKPWASWDNAEPRDWTKSTDY
ncbi:MAG: type II secretion system protein GspD [Verrucomicrobia bacterium]|nr:type II secretion system protein GspD [Verrucomicrobiota bacterium]